MTTDTTRDAPRFTGLAGKTALVTGASRGIGRAIALELARQGSELVLVARDDAALESVAASITAGGGRAHVIALDLSRADAADEVRRRTLAACGRLDLLINNAGATKRGEFIELADADWIDGFSLKFFGAVRLCRAFWPELKAARGSILSIAGVGGRTPDKAFTIGSSVNAACMAFTKALADAGLADGIRVNLVNPGMIRTDRLDKRVQAVMAAQQLDRAAAEAFMSQQGRITHLGEPREIAELVAYILSDQGRIFHGALIDADAGATKGV